MNTTEKLLFTDKYLGIPELEALHQQSKEWLSDVAFWSDEAGFLKKLIDKNFVHLMAGEGLSTVARLSDEVSKMKDTELKNLKGLLEIHEMRLAEFIENPVFHKEESYRKEHRRLESRVREMAMKNMALKRRIFGAAENVLMEERVGKIHA